MNDKEYAGFWIRLGALLIDVVIIMIVIYVPLSFIYGDNYLVGNQYYYGFWDVMIGDVLPIVATIWFWKRYRATPGKMATKLEIVDAKTGNTISTGQAIGRYLAYILAALPLCLGFIWVGIDKRKQGFHDKLAGTVVIRNTVKDPVRFEPSL